MRFLKENVLVCISALIAILIWIQKVLKNESPVIEGSKDEMKQETGGPRTEPDVMCKVTREIYDHWANITHPKLKGFAQDEILQFMEHFKQLTEGKIFGPAHKAFVILTYEVLDAKSIFAVHVVQGWGDINAWAQAPMNSYQMNIGTVAGTIAQGEKKKEAIRIFILSRTVAECPEMLKAAITVMKQHRDDGMTILVVWEEAVKDSSLIQNFVVIDNKVVEHGSEVGKCSCNDWLLRESTLSYNELEAQLYHRKFEFLKAYAKELRVWLAENNYQWLPDPGVKDETHTIN